MKIIIFDTETTGLPLPNAAPLEKQPKVIELGMVVLDKGTEHRLNWLINPGEQITEEITKITGITNDDLVGKPAFSEIVPEVLEWFAGSDVAIAHNAPFDTKLINFEFKRLGIEFPWPESVVCTVQEYTHRFGKRPKLTQLYEDVMGETLAQTHRAIDDALALCDALDKDGFLKLLGYEHERTTENQDGVHIRSDVCSDQQGDGAAEGDQLHGSGDS